MIMADTGADKNENAEGNIERENHEDKTANEEAPTIDAEEYETQFFRFTPQSFSDGLYNGMVSYIYEGFKKLSQCLIDEFPDLVTAEQNQKACDIIFPKITTTLEAAIDKLMIYLSSNIFCIPSHILLPEDEMQHHYPASKEDEDAIVAEINKLKHDIMLTKYRNSKLKQEIQDLSVIQEKWQTVLQEMKDSQKHFKESGITSIEEMMINLSGILKKITQSVQTLPQATRKRHIVNSTETASVESEECNNKIRKL